MLSFLSDELDLLRDKNLSRMLRILTPADSVHALYEGRKVTLFCGNDYLGLAHHPALKQAAAEALEKYGAGAGASRLISGSSDLHEKLEGKLAGMKRKKKALVFSAGYLANLGILSSLAGDGGMILMDKLCHASLIDGARLSGAEIRVFPHKNYSKCEDILKKQDKARRKILVTDSVFSMDGDLADLDALSSLRDRYECLLVVDDAHGTGVLGKTGRGALEGFERMDSIDAVTGTLSKALGGLGGFAAASEEIIDYLINKARPFIYATGLPPMLCAAALKAIELIETDKSLLERLWRNTEKLSESLGMKGRRDSPILPLIVGDEKKATEISLELLKKGILVPAVRYPTVAKGKARLRFTASAAHSEEDLEFLSRALR